MAKHKWLTEWYGSGGQFVASLKGATSENSDLGDKDGVKSNDSLSTDAASLYRDACEKECAEVPASSSSFPWSIVSSSDNKCSSFKVSACTWDADLNLLFGVIVLNMSNVAKVLCTSVLLGLWWDDSFLWNIFVFGALQLIVMGDDELKQFFLEESAGSCESSFLISLGGDSTFSVCTSLGSEGRTGSEAFDEIWTEEKYL